jgi:hypothetical protein
MRLRSREIAASFLSLLALAVALCAPLVVELHPQPVLSLGMWALGLALTAFGLRGPRLLYAVGAVSLWAVICAGLFTQVSPFSLPPGSLWGPRGLLLTSALLLWLWLHSPSDWLWRGAAATGIATFYVLGMLIITAPPIGRTVSFTWLAADSRGRLYATESDLGVIWAFDPDGSRSNLWPRRAVPGKTGPGLVPSGFGTELLQVQGANGQPRASLADANLLFCGLAVDAQDRVYMLDPDLRQVRQFTRDGELRGAWPLPASYAPARGCLAADAIHVYVGDSQAIIHVFGQDGQPITQWKQGQAPRGLTVSSEGLLVLGAQSIDVLELSSGTLLRTRLLPALGQGIGAPYQSLFMRSNGELLVSDTNSGRLRRFGPDGKEMLPIGLAASWPGQFAGPGGMPGELAEPIGLAEDRQQRLYVADTAFRIIQRFTGGAVDAVIAVPEQEATEMRPILP